MMSIGLRMILTEPSFNYLAISIARESVGSKTRSEYQPALYIRPEKKRIGGQATTSFKCGLKATLKAGDSGSKFMHANGRKHRLHSSKHIVRKVAQKFGAMICPCLLGRDRRS